MNDAMLTIIAAQHAGDGQAAVYGVMAPSWLAGMFVIGLVILIGIIKFIFGDEANPHQDVFIPPHFYDGQDQPDPQKEKSNGKETKP